MNNSKKNWASIIFLIFCTLLSLFVTISGILSTTSLDSLLFQLIFFPITIYFLVHTIQVIRYPFALEVKLSQKKTEILIASVLLLLLIANSLRNLAFPKITPEKNSENITATASPSAMIINSKDATPSAEVKKPVLAPPYVVIITKNPLTEVNIREKPNTTSDIILKTKKDAEFKYVKTQNTWYEVELSDGKTGWIHQDYVKLITQTL